MFLGGGDHSPGLISSYLAGEDKSTKHVPTTTKSSITLAAHGLEEYVSFPDFCDNHQFYVIYCV